VQFTIDSETYTISKYYTSTKAGTITGGESDITITDGKFIINGIEYNIVSFNTGTINIVSKVVISKTIQLNARQSYDLVEDILKTQLGLKKFDGSTFVKDVFNFDIGLDYFNYFTNTTFINNKSALIGVQAHVPGTDGKVKNYTITPYGAKNGGDIVHLMMTIKGASGANEDVIYILRIKINPVVSILSTTPTGELPAVSFVDNGEAGDKIMNYAFSNFVNVNNITADKLIISVLDDSDSQFVTRREYTNRREVFDLNGGNTLSNYGVKLYETILGGIKIRFMISDEYGFVATDANGAPIIFTLNYQNASGLSPNIVQKPGSIYESDTFNLLYQYEIPTTAHKIISYTDGNGTLSLTEDMLGINLGAGSSFNLDGISCTINWTTQYTAGSITGGGLSASIADGKFEFNGTEYIIWNLGGALEGGQWIGGQWIISIRINNEKIKIHNVEYTISNDYTFGNGVGTLTYNGETIPITNSIFVIMGSTKYKQYNTGSKTWSDYTGSTLPENAIVLNNIPSDAITAGLGTLMKNLKGLIQPNTLQTDILPNTRYGLATSIIGNTLRLTLSVNNNIGGEVGTITETCRIDLNIDINQRYRIQPKTPYGNFAEMYLRNNFGYDITNLFEVYDFKESRALTSGEIGSIEISDIGNPGDTLLGFDTVYPEVGYISTTSILEEVGGKLKVNGGSLQYDIYKVASGGRQYIKFTFTIDSSSQTFLYALDFKVTPYYYALDDSSVKTIYEE
jgi:hypothetical protein